MFCTGVLATLTLFLLVLLNPAASRAVHPTPRRPSPHFQGRCVSVLCVSNPASRQSLAAPRGLPELPVSVWCLAGADRESACSPVQVALQPPAASRPADAPGAPGLSLDPVSTPELRSSVRCLVAHAPGSRTQSAVSRVRVRGPPAPRCRWPASRQPSRVRSRSSLLSLLSQDCGSAVCPLPLAGGYRFRRPNAAAPSPFHLSSNICARFHGSPLRTSILRLEMFICRDPDVSSCVSG